MQILERKFTVYSGTVFENLIDCTHTEGEVIFYRKRFRRFSSPDGVYFSSRIEEEGLHAHEVLYDRKRADWISLFHQFDLRELPR